MWMPHGAQAARCDLFDKLRDFDGIDRPAPKEAICTRYVGLNGQTATACHWVHPFRAETAQVQADDIWRDIAICVPGSQQAPDTGVNHPDSQAQRNWGSDAGTFSVSIKDKGALQSTLVFLRFEPSHPR